LTLGLHIKLSVIGSLGHSPSSLARCCALLPSLAFARTGDATRLEIILLLVRAYFSIIVEVGPHSAASGAVEQAQVGLWDLAASSTTDVYQPLGVSTF